MQTEVRANLSDCVPYTVRVLRITSLSQYIPSAPVFNHELMTELALVFIHKEAN